MSGYAWEHASLTGGVSPPVFYIGGGFLWGEFIEYLIKSFNSPLFIVVISLIIIDVVTGVIVATLQKSGHTLHGSIESGHFIKGIYRKVLNILVYTLGVIFTFYTKQSTIEMFTAYAVITYEGISIIENFYLLGAPFPKKLKELFEVFKEQSGDDEK